LQAWFKKKKKKKTNQTNQPQTQSSEKLKDDNSKHQQKNAGGMAKQEACTTEDASTGHPWLYLKGEGPGNFSLPQKLCELQACLKSARGWHRLQQTLVMWLISLDTARLTKQKTLPDIFFYIPCATEAQIPASEVCTLNAIDFTPNSYCERTQDFLGTK